MIFSADHYMWLGGGLLLIFTGFTAMYLENEVYGAISLYISPIVIHTGYFTVLAGILRGYREKPVSHSTD
ncbi:MAG: hypothetical protein WDZ29_04770 [Balneolaceae bacterium]